MLFDAPALLAQARERAGLSQAQLADRAGTVQAEVSRYERGRMVPTTATLVRLLAAAGLQLRCSLEPLLADVDERVDAMLAGTPSIDLERLARVVASFATVPVGPVRWALDGASALACHGIGPGAEGPECLVLVLDTAARTWMSRESVRGTGAGPLLAWHDASLEEANAMLGDLAWSMRGLVRLRVVEELSTVMHVLPPGGAEPLPVLTVDAVAHAHPGLAEVLRRWRAREEQPRRTVGT